MAVSWETFSEEILHNLLKHHPKSVHTHCSLFER